MRRSIETIDLDHGSWLRLDCGHPVNESASAVNDDEPADCALCDRAQLPVGLIAVGPVRRRHIGDPRPCTVMTPTASVTVFSNARAHRTRQRGMPRLSRKGCNFANKSIATLQSEHPPLNVKFAPDFSTESMMGM